MSQYQPSPTRLRLVNAGPYMALLLQILVAIDLESCQRQTLADRYSSQAFEIIFKIYIYIYIYIYISRNIRLYCMINNMLYDGSTSFLDRYSTLCTWFGQRNVLQCGFQLPSLEARKVLHWGSQLERNVDSMRMQSSNI